MGQQANDLCARVSVRDLYAHLTGMVLSNRGIGLCPFHEDSLPSFSATDALWHCHAGCGSGNAIHFVERKLDMTFADALAWLAEYVGGHTHATPKARPIERRSSTIVLNPQVLAHFQPAPKHAIAYYHGRGLTDATIERYGLGWGVPPQSRIHRARFAIPFFDAEGRLRTFRFRQNPADSKDTGPKYISMTGAATYLFGLLQLPKSDWCVLCGSQFDAMLLSQWGLPAIAGAGEGTFKREWVHDLKGLGITTIFTLYDHDEGGWKGAAKVASVCHEEDGPHVVTVRWPADSPAKFDVCEAHQQGWQRADIVRLISRSI